MDEITTIVYCLLGTCIVVTSVCLLFAFTVILMSDIVEIIEEWLKTK